MRRAVLVEGVTDELALTLAARRLGRDLAAEGVTIVPTHGVHAFSRHLLRLAAEDPTARPAGLYDEGELPVVQSALERAGYGAGLGTEGLESIGFFACSADLEDELIRAAGAATMTRLIDLEGDDGAWHTFQKQHAWQGRPQDRQFRRFIRSVSSRNARYVRALVEAIEPAGLPRPLRLLLAHLATNEPAKP